MPTFIALFSWTGQGVRNVKDTDKRAATFKQSIQASGGSVKNIYWTMGRYDGVIIFEAPDDTTAAAIMMGGCSLREMFAQKHFVLLMKVSLQECCQKLAPNKVDRADFISIRRA